MTPNLVRRSVSAGALVTLTLSIALSGCSSSASHADSTPTRTSAAVRSWPTIEKRGALSRTITLRSPSADARYFIERFRCTRPAASVVRTHSVVKNAGSVVLEQDDRYYESGTCHGTLSKPIERYENGYAMRLPAGRRTYTFRITVPKGSHFQFTGYFTEAKANGLAPTGSE
jgi:uncharacterized protein YceK